MRTVEQTKNKIKEAIQEQINNEEKINIREICEKMGVLNQSDKKLEEATNELYLKEFTNGGSSWSQVASQQNWRAIATSQNGQVVIAAAYGGTLYVSIDSGATWTPRESARKWSSVSISDDGTVMVATVAGGGVYVSRDNGVAWDPIAGIERRTWNSVSCDARCAYFAITSVSGNLALFRLDGAAIFNGLSNSKWSTVTLNSLGDQIIAGAQSGALRTSVNSGSTWSQRTRIAN